ncbi:MAG: Gfo/Idh/MocA family oxidoreductase [Desulfuromonadaceae bacterium]|nr:Gfo/Idh/MocA family oxidoreductase [Desulfuromonadaceae bacterium]
MKKVYSVLIIGAGKIGAFFDTPENSELLTHAHAFSSHPSFKLTGFVDTDSRQAERASKIWGGEAFPAIADAFSLHAVDVAVVAAPDALHFPLLKELADYPLELVFAEKPLAKTVYEAEEIIALYKKRGIRLAVNYSRRFVPEFSALASEIASGVFGGYIAGSGYYGKGIIHNGTHMIDLLRFLLGEIKVADLSGSIYDHFEDDPTCSSRLDIFGGSPFFMQGISCKLYTIFELDLFFERKRVRIVDSGFKIEKYDIRNSDIFAGYRYLQPGHTIETSLGNAMKHAVDQIYSCLIYETSPISTGSDALTALKIACEILELDNKK